MKNAVIVVLSVACVAVGVIDLTHAKKLREQGEQLALAQKRFESLQAEMNAKNDAVDNAKLSEAKTKILQQTLAESTSAAAEQSRKAEKLQQSLDESKTNNPIHNIASMFKDPKMREMMKAQQKAAMGPIIARQYADLFKQLNLSDDQAASLKDLMQKKMLTGADVGMSMMDDSLDASQRADLTKQAKSQMDEVNNEIKQLLGDDNYQAFQSYEKSVPDRMTVGQFSDQFTGTDNALSTDQQHQLIQAMSDARSSFNWTSGLNQPSSGVNVDIASQLTEENIDKFTHEREQFDQTVVQRVGQFLTPAQSKSFEEFLANQRQLQIAGWNMAKQMYGH